MEARYESHSSSECGQAYTEWNWTKHCAGQPLKQRVQHMIVWQRILERLRKRAIDEVEERYGLVIAHRLSEKGDADSQTDEEKHSISRTSTS